MHATRLPATPGLAFLIWTSTPVEAMPGSAFAVNFENGASDYFGTTTPFPSFCVRGP